MSKIYAPALIITAMLLIFGALLSNQAHSQQPQVRCESLMYPGTIQIFNGYQCPAGWAPV